MNSFRQTAVGIFVLLGLVCVAYLTIKLGKMEVFDSKGFELVANFNSVSGLRVGADVEMAGVPVGRVASIKLDDDLSRRQARGVLIPGQGPAAARRYHRLGQDQRSYR